jgi:hypothetical protein
MKENDPTTLEGVSKTDLHVWCSQLGADHDPTVCYSYPNKNNYCYKLENPRSIHLDHQTTHCLTRYHSNCVIFQLDHKARRIPKDLLLAVLPRKKNSGTKRFLLFILAVMIAGVIFSLAFLNFYELNNLYFPNTTSNYNFGSSSAETKTSTSSNDLDLLFLFPRRTETKPIETATKDVNTRYPTPAPELGTPIGSKWTYILHQVELVDNLIYLANLYDTKIETIQSINCLQEGSPIRIDQILVIMPGKKETTNFICLSATKIEKDTALQVISAQFKTTEENLIQLNDLGEIKTIPAGRWLIVPLDNPGSITVED